MLITAKMNFRYLWRLGLIALICLGGALWCLYDAAITYPKELERSKIFKEMDEQEPDKEVFWRKWNELAEEKGWPKKKPKDEFDIKKQYGMALIIFVPGIIYLYLFLRNRPRWMELNDTGIRTSWGPHLEFGQIVSLDKKKWKTKGIAKIRYEQDGRTCRLALDDWKFDTPETKAMLREVESRIDIERIVGGPPETDEPEEDPPGEAPADDTAPSNG